MITKKCSKCQIPKELEFFSKSKDKKYGVQSMCKECRKNKYYEDKPIIKILYQENHEQIIADKKQYYKDNTISIKLRIKKYRNNRIKNDPLYKMSCNISTLIRNSFKKKFTKKAKRIFQILGCTYEEFYKHLESKFDEHMNWSNQGTYWHMDHIKPISLATTEQEVYELNHYTNFQPLKAEDNLKKEINILYNAEKVQINLDLFIYVIN